MSSKFTRITIRNFRSLAKVEDLPIGDVTVLFGPNGSGKSTFLDAIAFIGDCAARGVAEASASRSQGIGLLFDGAPDESAIIEISLAMDDLRYTLALGMADGRVAPWPGERLSAGGETLIDRPVGADRAALRNDATKQFSSNGKLRDPEQLALSTYLNLNPDDATAGQIDQLLRSIRSYDSRSFALQRLRSRGSESDFHTVLLDRGQNLWSVLRNIKDKADLDDRYQTIVAFMKKAFPTFRGIVFEQTGPNSVYASFQESNRRNPISASGASDGHLQLLLLLTALFAEDPSRPSLILFDEPEISLHPWAIAVFAEAAEAAAASWSRQVVMATHSPVLISQFEPNEILAAVLDNGQTQLQRVAELAEIGDLLEEYSVGSLYMAEAVAGQSAGTPNSDEK